MSSDLAGDIACGSSHEIDWAFILAQEGGASTSIYVPQDDQHRVIGLSGPTIGCGFDLGQRCASDLWAIGLSPPLIDRLAPYLGRQGDAARIYVDEHPLILACPDVDALDEAVRDHTRRELAARFNADSRIGPFNALPANTQTAIADLYHQYGLGDPARATPRFWRQITHGDWRDAYDNLQDFGDQYPRRRRLEAVLLKQDIDAGVIPLKVEG